MEPTQPPLPSNPPVIPTPPPVAPTPGEDPGKTLGIIGFVLAFLGLQLIGLILSVIGYKKSKAAGFRNGLAKAGIWLNSILLVVGAVIIGIAIALGISAGMQAQKMKAVSSAAINDVQEGKTTELYNLTSEGFRAATSQAVLEATVEQLRPQLQGQEEESGFTVQSSNGQDYAAVVYKVPTSQGPHYFKVVLKKSGDNWQVQSLQAAETDPGTAIE